VAEELHVRHTKPRGGGQLLALSECGQSFAIDVRLPGTLVTGGDEDKIDRRRRRGRAT
jgi:hypothetical protein